MITITIPAWRSDNDDLAASSVAFLTASTAAREHLLYNYTNVSSRDRRLILPRRGYLHMMELKRDAGVGAGVLARLDFVATAKTHLTRDTSWLDRRS